MNVIRDYLTTKWGRTVRLVDLECECGYKVTRPRCIAHKLCPKCQLGTHKHARDNHYDLTYHSWENMRARCNNPKNPYYHKYGGAGITVCEEWDSFKKFLSDVGERPTKNHTLDRIDNSQGYNKQNCRWATRREQQRNRTVNHLVQWEGRMIPLVEFIEITGITTVHYHLKRGRTLEEIAALYKRPHSKS